MISIPVPTIPVTWPLRPKVADLTQWGVIPLIITALLLAGCGSRSPAPPDAIKNLKEFIESDGRQAPATDVFSMPSFGTAAPAVVVNVSSIDYEGALGRLTKETRGVPAGTKLYYYGVKDSRTKGNGTQQMEDRLFLVYQDPAGAWGFVETRRPDHGDPKTEALK